METYMKCSQCEGTISEEAKYCSDCGSKIAFKLKNKEGNLIAIIPASQSKRLMSTILETPIPAILGIPLFVIFVLIGAAVGASQDTMMNYVWPVSAITVTIYFIIFEGLFSRTVSKMITGSIVINAKGNKISWKQSIIRSLARLIPFDALSFLGSKNPIGWHDSLAKTYVVDSKVLKSLK